MRIPTLLVTAGLVLALAAPAPAASTTSTPAAALERVAGADRFATAAALAERAAAGGAQRVWIATGATYPDALAVAATGEPLLLVERDRLPEPAAAALRRIDPEEVVAVGGTSAVSDATLAHAAERGRARGSRVAGPDRYATSAEVARRTRTTADVVWLATGVAFPDALAAGPVAAADRAPLLLLAAGQLPTPVRAELERLRPAEVVVVGGERAVAPEVAAEAARAAGGATLTRLAGPSRFDTAAAVARRGRDRHRMGSRAFVATGQTFPDALAAGPAAGRVGAPLLLAAQRDLTAPTRTVLQELAPTAVTVVGGERVLSLTVAHRAAHPTAQGVCDAYDATRPGTIQGHPEQHRPSLDAWSGPWVVDTFRGGWGLAVPHRWRSDEVEAFEHGGVLFYVDTEDGYTHWLRVTVLCGNPFLVAGGRALDPSDPQQIKANGPHTVLGPPTSERIGGPAIYSATWHQPDHVRRYDYVAVGDDVIMVHYDATNRFANQFGTKVARIADAVAASAAPAAQATCPPNASRCLRR